MTINVPKLKETAEKRGADKERARILELINQVEIWVKNEYGTYLQEIILPTYDIIRQNIINPKE